MTQIRTIAEVAELALLVWREARGETYDAKVAVAYVVVERAKIGGWWGNSILEVMAKPYQFSSMTDPKDRQLVKWPLWTPDYEICVAIARDVLSGVAVNPMHGADHYHDTSIAPPEFTHGARYLGKLGRLMFYRVTKG